MKISGPRPINPKDLRQWLESYQEWLEQLKAGGLYQADPDGTSVKSTRAGRPTETTAVFQADLAERCRVIETWLLDLSDAERLMVGRYLSGGAITARMIARQLQLKYDDTAAAIRVLPTLIYLEWYGTPDSG